MAKSVTDRLMKSTSHGVKSDVYLDGISISRMLKMAHFTFYQ